MLVTRVLAFLVGLAVSMVVATHLAEFLERDTCADAAGIYVASTGACVTPHETGYVPQMSRPRLYGFWAVFLLIAFVPGWLCTILLRRSGHLVTKFLRSERPRDGDKTASP